MTIENLSNEPVFHMYMLFYVEKYKLSILFYSIQWKLKVVDENQINFAQDEKYTKCPTKIMAQKVQKYL